MRMIQLATAALLLSAALAGCDRQAKVEAPPRATDKAPSPTQKSLIAVPINASTASLKQALERAVPKTLWTINQRERACVQPQRVKLFGKKVKVTPTIVQAIGGVTLTFLPNSLTRCGWTHARSRRLIVHSVLGTARSSACLSDAVLAFIGTAINDFCVGEGALSVARGGASIAVWRSQPASDPISSNAANILACMVQPLFDAL